MKKQLIPFVAAALLGTTIVSCGSSTAWTWANATADGTIKYCLLIGQIDHNDSAARTAGIRDALGTRGTKKTNPNTETAVEGKLTLGGKEYKVVEIEAAEQKNTAGATWDQQTATNTTETWINKHGNDIDLFVSNNDGMAVGAIGATNWIENEPIFGYDSNADALQYIKDGKIMGTVNQNASAQAAGIFMLTRNALDKVAEPTAEGFSKASTNGYGKIDATYNYNATNKSMLVDNFAITSTNVDKYVGKTAAQLVDTNVTKGTTASKKVWMSYYSASDTFLNSNMKPLFEIYDDKFNLDITYTSGDGAAETSSLNNLESAAVQDGYIINMVKTTSTNLYLDKIATKLGATSSSPTDVPVVFWNRQGTNADGSVDTVNMADARFNSIYYVGFDANQGGQLQGEMIVDWLKAQK